MTSPTGPPSGVSHENAQKSTTQETSNGTESLAPPVGQSDEEKADSSKVPGTPDGSTTLENRSLDNNTVWWDGDDDPENPYNWPAWRKYVNCGLISALTFVTPLASSIFAPGVPQLMQDFNSSNQELAAFVVSVYVLGFAFGPMVMAPMSEVYGRTPVYIVCNIGFVAFTIGCALAPTLDSLIGFRFLAGLFGACPLTNGGGSIADMITQEKRAAAMVAFSLGPLMGPILGPVVGGVVQEHKGWRWVFWILAIVGGAIALAMILFMRETYAPVLLERRAKKLRKETGNQALQSKLDTGLSQVDLFKRAIVRPAKLLVFSPICTIFAVYMAIVYGYLYFLFTTVPFVFQRSYGFSPSNVGLVYLGLGIGSFAGMGWFSVVSKRELEKQRKKMEQNGETGDVKPEVRLTLLPAGSILLPVGFFIYGWTTHFKTHWMGPIVGLTIIGVGNIICFMAVSMYLVDAYMRFAASALAANTIIRSVAGAVLPLCALDMYDALGLGWGNSLLGFIAIAFLPVPFLILRYGERLRIAFKPDRL